MKVEKLRTNESMDFDRILEHIGSGGIWQCLHLGILSLVAISSGITFVSFAFTGYIPKHRCLVPQCEMKNNATYYAYEEIFSDYVNATMQHLDSKEQSCKRIALDHNLTCPTFQDFLQSNGPEDVRIESCPINEIIYDRSKVLTSITEDLGLICSDSIMQQVFSALFLIGNLIGSLTLGIVSDRFGRLRALTLSLLIVGISGVLRVLTKNRLLFATLRVVSGIGGIGGYIAAKVMAMESTLPDKKIIPAFVIGLGFVVGELVLAMEAFYIREWIPLQLWAFLPSLILIIVYFILPESTRWLISQGKLEQAQKDLVIRATINKRDPIPREHFEEINFDTLKKSEKSSINFLDLFKQKIIRRRTFNMFVQWFSVTMAYYGLLFASTSLSGDPYLNFPLVILAELPSSPFFLLVPHYYGRRLTMVIAQLIGGACCIIGGLLSLWPEYGSLQVVLVMLGRLFASIAFGLLYLYTGELFPTDIRNTAIGACSTIARIGGVLALLMQDLKQVWPPLTMVCFGSIATLAGFLAFLFPETVNDKLPETIEDALNLGRNIKRNAYGFIIRSPQGK